MTDAVSDEPALIDRLVGFEEMLKFGGLKGESRVNLMVAGEEVPWAYSMSRVGLAPVARMFNPALFVPLSRSVRVEAQAPPKGCLM